MSNEILKFKKKITIEGLIKSLFISSIVSFIPFATIVLTLKIIKIEFNILPYLLISIGAFLLISIILFLFFKPNNYKVAKRLDNDLELNEMVQTMVEYENNDTPIVSYQRELTNNKLKEIPTKNLKFKFSIVLICLSVFSLASFATALAVPGYKKPEETENKKDPENNFTYSAADSAVIRQLIQEIKIDPLVLDDMEAIYVAELEKLDTELSQIPDNYKQLIKNCIDNSKAGMDKINTSNQIYESVYNSIKEDSYLIRDIKELLLSIKALNSQDDVERMAYAIRDRLISSTDLYKDVTSLREAIEPNIKEQLLTKYPDDLAVKGLYYLANDFSNHLSDLSKNINTEQIINDVFTNNVKVLSEGIKYQIRNKYWYYEINNRLASRFLDGEGKVDQFIKPDDNGVEEPEKIPPLSDNTPDEGEPIVIIPSEEKIYLIDINDYDLYCLIQNKFSDSLQLKLGPDGNLYAENEELKNEILQLVQEYFQNISVEEENK